jgi:hypothetical protein
LKERFEAGIGMLQQLPRWLLASEEFDFQDEES